MFEKNEGIQLNMRRKLDHEDEPLIACFKKVAVEESEVVYVELGYKACRVF